MPEPDHHGARSASWEWLVRVETPPDSLAESLELVDCGSDTGVVVVRDDGGGQRAIVDLSVDEPAEVVAELIVPTWYWLTRIEVTPEPAQEPEVVPIVVVRGGEHGIWAGELRQSPRVWSSSLILVLAVVARCSGEASTQACRARLASRTSPLVGSNW